MGGRKAWPVLLVCLVSACAGSMSQAKYDALMASMPPFAAEAEPPAAEAGDRVEATVRYCEPTTRAMLEGVGGRIVRTQVTDTAQWGVVWRADVAYDDEKGREVYRHVCWGTDEAPGGFIVKPLEMFDPAQNTAPLPAG